MIDPASFDPERVSSTARAALDIISELMESAPEGARRELVRLRGQMDQYRKVMSDAGWTDGQVGALVFDSLLMQGHDHSVCVLVAMEVLK